MAGADVHERLAALPGVARCTITDDSVVLVAAPEADARLLRARAQAVCGDVGDPRALVVAGGRGYVVATTTATPVHFGDRPRTARPAMVVAASLLALAAIAVAPSDDGRSPVGGRRPPGVSSAAQRPPGPAATPSGDVPEPVARGVAFGAAPALGAPAGSGAGAGAGAGGVASGMGGLLGALSGGTSPAVAPAAGSPLVDDRPRPALLAVARSRLAVLRLISSSGGVAAGVSVREVALGSPAPERTSTAAAGDPPSEPSHAAEPSHVGPHGSPAAPATSAGAQVAAEPERRARAASGPSVRVHPEPAAPGKGGPEGGRAHRPGRTEQGNAHHAGGAADPHRGADPSGPAGGGSGRGGEGSGRRKP